MKPTLAFLFAPIAAVTLLGACGSVPVQNTTPRQESKAMPSTPPVYTPPLAKDYQPGVPTVLEQIAPQSPYDADEAVRRILRIATQLQKREDLTPALIEQTMGLKMPFPKDGSQEERSGVYWLNKNWLYDFRYAMRSYGLDNIQAPVLTFKFIYDNARWADMPDRAELCAGRQMDIAAAEKVLLDNGFRMNYWPNNNRKNLWWGYYKEGKAGVDLFFFQDIRPIDSKKACIREIRVSIN